MLTFKFHKNGSVTIQENSAMFVFGSMSKLAPEAKVNLVLSGNNTEVWSRGDLPGLDCSKWHRECGENNSHLNGFYTSMVLDNVESFRIA